jgi:hypothetical protein
MRFVFGRKVFGEVLLDGNLPNYRYPSGTRRHAVELKRRE